MRFREVFIVLLLNDNINHFTDSFDRHRTPLELQMILKVDELFAPIFYGHHFYGTRTASFAKTH